MIAALLVEVVLGALVLALLALEARPVPVRVVRPAGARLDEAWARRHGPGARPRSIAWPGGVAVS